MAVRASLGRIAEVDSAWTGAKVVARPVTVSVPAMPLTDWQLMQGARERAFAVREVLVKQNLDADLYVGLEGGFRVIRSSLEERPSRRSAVTHFRGAPELQV